MVQISSNLDQSLWTIPASWPEAAMFFAELRNRTPLTEDEWRTVIEWLLLTKFNDRSYLAGEVAAGLLRDLAPQHLKSRVKFGVPPDQWQQRLQSIVSSPVNLTAELGGGPTHGVSGMRRVKVERRRQIDPTTCERDYTDEEIEFMKAMDLHKRKTGRMFPTYSEILEVLHSLGYQRLPKTPDLADNQNIADPISDGENREDKS